MIVTEIIQKVAAVTSFSSWEERLHPLIRELLRPLDGVEVTHVPDNNLVIKIPGSQAGPPIALTAHLDKISHFGRDSLDLLPVSESGNRLKGQLDNSAGVGICLSLALRSKTHSFPPLLLLFSEMEESKGLRNHPWLLKGNGEGLHPRIGAERISRQLIASRTIPQSVITVDTTPRFRGEAGIAIYSEHWLRNGLTPSTSLISATENLVRQLRQLNPRIVHLNNINDYVAYGLEFNRSGEFCVPSIALEPAIFPYHCRGEEVFISDIVDTE